MESNRIIELLTRKLANEATDQELAELHELISRNPDSIYYEEALKELWLPAANSTDTDRAFKKHILKFQNELNFEEEVGEISSKRSSSFLKRHIKSAAVVFSLLILSVSGYFFLANSVKNSVPVHTEVVAGKGMRKQITLPDGTHVWLNAESKLSFDLDMREKSQRLVKLSGEAFFDVTHDKKHPFIVVTDKMVVKVLGTAFNIKAYQGEKKVETTLIRGSVELSVKGSIPQKFILKPSEKFILEDNEIKSVQLKSAYPINDRTLLLQNIDPILMGDKEYIEETSWTENRLVFKNETFAELKPKLERWFNVSIELKNEDIGEYRFTGIFTNENINQALTAMQLIQPFHFKLKSHDVIIY